MDDPKPFWQSSTFWGNVIAIVGVVGGGVPFIDIAMQPETQGAVAGIVIAVGNLVNRFRTSRPITLR